jgi:type II secretion system protein C
MLIKKSAIIGGDTAKVVVAVGKSFKMIETAKVPLGQIYGKRDIFGLGQGSNAVEQAKSVITSNIPELVIPEISKAPASPVIDFVDPLPITLNGIIGSSTLERSICIIADENDKEATYKIGDRIKDGTIIKILRDRVVVLRLNGQIETFFLHEVGIPQVATDLSTFVTPIADNKFRIDTEKFKHKIVNLGGFLDHFDMVPFVGDDGKVIGIVVTDKDPKSFASLLGFKENDLILSIDGIGLTSNKDRLKAYDQIVNKSDNSEFFIEFERDSNRLNNSYLLSSKPQKASMTTGFGGENLASVTGAKEVVGAKEKTKTVFPELLGKEEQKKADNMYQENINRIRQEMLARMQRNG